MDTKEEGFYLNKFIPTLISLLALCCGVSSVKYAYAGYFIVSASLLLIACFLDGIDGRVARYLNVSSSFGVEMDSLADLVNFGVAPGFIVYNWKLMESELEVFGWFAVMLLACCMAIRLARFNVDLGVRDQNDPLVKYFFRGMPAPAVAAMSIFPLVLSFQFGYGFYNQAIYVLLNTIILALFAGSVIPTPCFKKVKVPEKFKFLVQIFSCIWVILLVLRPWLALSILGILYTISIVIGIYLYISIKNRKIKGN